MSPPDGNLIPFFFGRDPYDEGEPEDPFQFIENVKSTIDDRIYEDEIKRPLATGIIFRMHLKEKAWIWYQSLSTDIRKNWHQLEDAFLSRFENNPKIMDRDRFFRVLYNFKQNGRTLSEYIKEADQLRSQCPAEYRHSIASCFITGLDERRKMHLALYHLTPKKNLSHAINKKYISYVINKKKISWAQAKAAVIKAHSELLGRKNRSNTVRNYLPRKPSTSVTQSDLVLSPQGSEELPCLEPIDNAPYRPLNTSQNYTGGIQADRGIYCNHCREEGHYSISCTRPVASPDQREASRLSIDKLQKVPSQCPPSQYLPSPNQAQLPPQALNQAHEYPQSLYQDHEYPLSLYQDLQYPLSLYQDHQYPLSLYQDHYYPQSPSQDPHSLNETHEYPQSLQQNNQYPQSLNQASLSLYLYQDHEYPQIPSQASHSLNQAHEYPLSLYHDYQYPLSLHQDQQYPQSPSQVPHILSQAHQYPQSLDQTHQYPQSIDQTHQYPPVSNYSSCAGASLKL